MSILLHTQQSRRTLLLGTLSLSLVPRFIWSASSQTNYPVKYSGGSWPNVKTGQDLKLYLDQISLRFEQKNASPISIPASAITEVNYGQEVHRRIGTAVGLAVVSFGIGALMAFSKSKKHYIGLVWDDSGKKGGIAMQANKDEYRGLIAALEGLTGKKAIDTDAAATKPSS